MMENLAANKSSIPCLSWAETNGWPTSPAPSPLFTPQPSSQTMNLGLSSDQRPVYNHLQAPAQSCMSNISSLSSTHHSGLYKASHSCSNSSPTSLFGNTTISTSSHGTPFSHQSLHTSSVLLTTNQGKNVPPPSLPAPQPQHLPLLSSHDPYTAAFQPPLANQCLPDLPTSLPPCGQHVSSSQATVEGANVEFAAASEPARSHLSSTSQEEQQWMSSSHCRGAVNKSVPDAAAPAAPAAPAAAPHHNSKPSQEGNVSPLSNNERWRSGLLRQRALLLKQLEELDKLLESIPSGESSDGQSSNTATATESMEDSSKCEHQKTGDEEQVPTPPQNTKSSSPLPEGWLSPLSCDEEWESHRTPEAQASPAESVKKENSSAGSEGDDSDPDYSPKSNGDLSNGPAEPEEDSTDDSSHSSPPTPTHNGPSLRSKTRAGRAFSMARCAPPPKKRRTSNEKTPDPDIVLPCSSSKSHRVYDKRNYCLFCSKPMSKMSRHLETIHGDKAEVAAAMQYPKCSRERQRIWSRLTKQGNFAHNKVVLKTGKGQLAVRKRPNHARQAKDFLHCLYCRGLFMKHALHRHMKQCPERVNSNEVPIGRKRIALRCVLEATDDLDISDGMKLILSQMTYDDVTEAIMDDRVILQFGDVLFNKHGADTKKHDYIRQNLRQIARLLLEAKKISPMKTLQDFFVPSNFPHVVSAVNVLAGYDAENKTYSIPSLAVKLGYHLQKTCGIVVDNAVKRDNASVAESARSFLSIYQKKWNKLISAGALTALRETKLNTEKKVPFAQDIKKLNSHLENVHTEAEKKLRESPSPENYGALARVILARTIIFNRRRATEVSSVKLTNFNARNKSTLDSSMDVSVSDMERTMCSFFTRVDIRGKCGRMVPVLLKPAFERAMELFVNLRKTCGVPSENPYLFARPQALSYYNGAECIQKFVKACGAKDPEALTSPKIRKHYVTMLQLINLEENEADQILGPNNQVRTLRQDNSVQLNDWEMSSDGRLQPRKVPEGTSWNQSEHPDAAEFYHDEENNSGSSPPAAKKDAQHKARQKWEEAEILAVEKHLSHLIQQQKVPQKQDCIQCLLAEPEALKTRTWKGIKDYVRNRITALKRQSGGSQATSTDSGWPEQEEQQNFELY